jgi:hypothetical protein
MVSIRMPRLGCKWDHRWTVLNTRCLYLDDRYFELNGRSRSTAKFKMMVRFCALGRYHAVSLTVPRLKLVRRHVGASPFCTLRFSVMENDLMMSRVSSLLWTLPPYDSVLNVRCVGITPAPIPNSCRPPATHQVRRCDLSGKRDIAVLSQSRP